MKVSFVALMLFGLFAMCIAKSKKDRFGEWKAKFNGSVHCQRKSSTEIENNFNAADDVIEKHNNGSHSFTLGHNHMSCLSQAEYLALQTLNADAAPGNDRKKRSLIHRAKRQGVAAGTTVAPAWLPTSVDWRLDNIVTAVKNQGGCGDCYVFSATGAMEGQYMRKYGGTISMSEQQPTDCCVNCGCGGCGGCNGGWMQGVFAYSQKGDNSEASYPFTSGNTGSPGTCRYNSSIQSSYAAASTNSALTNPYQLLTVNDETAMMIAVARQGPISVAIDASSSQFGYYSGGVFNYAGCTQYIDHAVLVVGYGVDATAGAYWILKNSWTTGWGESGYMRMARNAGNMCAIASYGMFPIIA